MMPKTRKVIKEFGPRLQCRVAGHDMEPWQIERRFVVEGQSMIAQSRACRRNCGLLDSFEARVVQDYPGS